MTRLNVGNLDRAARMLLGLVLVVLAATGRIGLWGWIGVLPLATGAVAFCPLYSLLGWRTKSVTR